MCWALHLILLRNRKTQLLLHTASVHSILIWNSSDTLSNKQLPLLHRLTARAALQRWSGHPPHLSTQNTAQRHQSSNGQGTQADFNAGLLKINKHAYSTQDARSNLRQKWKPNAEHSQFTVFLWTVFPISTGNCNFLTYTLLTRFMQC